MGKEESGRGIPVPFLMAVVVSIATATAVEGAGKNCTRRCGEKVVPYPFGLEDESENCYLSSQFVLTCNRSSDPPKLFTRLFLYADDGWRYTDRKQKYTPTKPTGAFEVADIFIPRGFMRVLAPVTYRCYGVSNTESANNSLPIVMFPDTFALSSSENVFTAVGCETDTWLLTETDSWVGCMLGCRSLDGIRDGRCLGTGCCQVDIPEKATYYNTGYLPRSSSSNTSIYNNCSYSFPVERGRYSFNKSDISYMVPDTKVSLILDWFVGDRSCEEAAKNLSTYACVSSNSHCLNSTNGPGYICNCSLGYQGNPYVKDGCQDIDECKLDRQLYPCQGVCINTNGSYNCMCPKGKSSADPYKQPCIETEQLSSGLKAGIGVVVGLGVVSILVVPCWFLYKKSKKRSARKLRAKLFRKNYQQLEQLVTSLGGNVWRVRILPLMEIEKATNKFDATRVVGRGGYGTVYKGLLMDNTVVAIKRSNKLDQKEAEQLDVEIQQFINEVAILSQIDHRNVVRLIGCCLETEVPLLVYEFISNGTLSHHLHKTTRSSSLSWDDRLRIALEIASAISYMHSAASRSIFHRDLKTCNVLIDEKLTAKVSDFGTSKSVTTDQTQVATMVQGTYGYLDPQYLHTGLLTEKSDVYSWGVILLELLTGETAFPTEGGNLTSNFMLAFKEQRVGGIIEALIIKETGKEDLQVLIDLAERCLRFKGEERPTMKEVEMVLQNLWSQRTHR